MTSTRVAKRRILVVEDEQAIRDMVRYALESAGFAVEEAEDAKEAQRQLADRIPHLILLDWMLPSVSGIEFTKQLKKNKTTLSIPIIMLTAKAGEENKVQGLEAGADDYVIKPFSPRELIARVRAVLRRGPLEHPDGKIIIQNLVIDTSSQRVSANNESVRLGPLEYRLLNFFVTHQNRVYTRDELLTHVWGGDVYVDERTVDALIRRLRKQLLPHGYDRLIQTVHGSGYRFSEYSDGR